MRILATGKNGQVVTALKAFAGDHEIITLGRPEADMSRPESLRAPVKDIAPDIIVSLAAYTQVDKAEGEPDMAHIINAEAPAELARLAREMDIPIIHLSTDYVFDGRKASAYIETDIPAPINIYGVTKGAGEKAIIAETDNHVILRTSWVYSPYGRNFVKTMLALAESRDAVNVVADQWGCPTSAIEIARNLLSIAERLRADKAPELRGVFHLVAPDEANWAQLAQAVFEDMARRGNRRVEVQPIASSAYPTPAMRPANSRLNTDKLLSVYGLRLRPWRQALDEVLEFIYTSGPKSIEDTKQSAGRGAK